MAESAIDRARRDPAVFAELLVGAPLWPHQLEVARSAARYRLICAGRRSGKTRVFGVLALHTVYSRARAKVLIVSAGEVASKRMFADIAALARSSPLLSASVIDESTRLLVLTNGSRVECVPASMAQVRSAEADLLIVDEAGFVANRDLGVGGAGGGGAAGVAGAAVQLAVGRPEAFFRQLWSAGMASPSAQLEAWHWPSSVSPLVDDALLAQIRERSSPLYFQRRVPRAVDGRERVVFRAGGAGRAPVCELVPPMERWLGGCAAGIDWGFAHDASTLVVVAGAGEAGGRPKYRVASIEERFATPYASFIALVVKAAKEPQWGRGYAFGTS